MPGGSSSTPIGCHQNQGHVPILSLWDRHPGGQSSFRTSIFVSDRTKTPCTFNPGILRTKVFPGYRTPGYPSRGFTLQHQLGAIRILSLRLACGSAAGRPLPTPTTTFTPRDLENKSFTRKLTTRGGKWGNNTYHH